MVRFLNCWFSYQVVYGQPHPLLPGCEAGTIKLEFVDWSSVAWSRVLSLLKTNMAVAQNRMKLPADKKRTKCEFATGGLAYLRFVPYRHASLSSHLFHQFQTRILRRFLPG